MLGSFSKTANKDGALDEGVEEVADGVVVLGAGVEEGFDFGAVGEADGGAGGVDGELVEEVASELAGVGGTALVIRLKSSCFC